MSDRAVGDLDVGFERRLAGGTLDGVRQVPLSRGGVGGKDDERKKGEIGFGILYANGEDPDEASSARPTAIHAEVQAQEAMRDTSDEQGCGATHSRRPVHRNQTLPLNGSIFRSDGAYSSRRARERLLEELGVGQIDLDDQPLARGVEVQPLDRGERRRVQQPLGRLARLLDVLVQHACRIVRRSRSPACRLPSGRSSGRASCAGRPSDASFMFMWTTRRTSIHS